MLHLRWFSDCTLYMYDMYKYMRTTAWFSWCLHALTPHSPAFSFTSKSCQAENFEIHYVGDFKSFYHLKSC